MSEEKNDKRMSLINVNRTDHFCMLVSNIENAKEYYNNLFNWNIFYHPINNKTLMVETKNLHFFIKEVKLYRDFFALQHYSFEVEDISEIIMILDQNNIKYEKGNFSSFKFNNYTWVEWRDPDGIRLECIERLG